MEIGDIVVITVAESLTSSFIGQYGKISDLNKEKYGEKVMVEVNARVGNRGSLRFTMYPREFKVVGTTNI
ncbi:hypothetical protein [Priestia aryabhattai]